ncbi:MAG: glycosyltransferase, partial [Cyanobacteria bacterium J06598_1]
RPRIVILGSIDYQKGFHLIQEVYPQLTRFSDLYFVGSGEKGEIFAKQKGVHVIKEYTHQDLPAIFKEVAPDLALLLSVWPETYSYTLSELFMLKVPVVATHLGSFADRIDEGATGFLVEPTADQLLVKVKDLLYGHRAKLDSVVETLTQMSHRTIPEMISDYSALIAIQPTQQSSDIYTFTESVLLSRQLSLDINKLDRKKSAWKFKRKNTFSERVPITARFTLLNSIKNRFPKTWERIKAPIIRIYTRITY